jgi:DNA-binding GntR family transcriptional regulator
MLFSIGVNLEISAPSGDDKEGERVGTTTRSGWLSTAPPTSQTKVSAAYETIRRAIEEGALPPGQRLPMSQLEAELGMSPTPIREALRLLQSDGVVEHQPHRGMIVAEYTAEDVDEIFRLRLALEPLATGLAAERATAEELAHIAELHEEHVQAVAGDTAAAAVALNTEWHRAIYATCGSRILQEFINRLWMALPVRAVWVSSEARHSLEEHVALMDALLARDGARATTLMAEHLERGKVMITARMSKRGG